MGTAASWRYQLDAFAEDRLATVPDQHYSLTSIKEMAENIAPRLPRLFDLVGWSMGGYIVFELYPLVRDRVRSLILISTTARGESPDARARRADLAKRLAMKDLWAILREQIDYGIFEPSQVDESFKIEVALESAKLGEQTLHDQIRAISSRRDSRPSLSSVTAKALIIAGRRDPIIPVEESEEIASLLPGSALQILDDVGHCPPWERPTLVNGLMRDFLDGRN
jgi:pimeloyl-ACP methyl ester carboxylesterase